MSFSVGFQGVDEAAKQSEQRKASSFGGPKRLWMQPGEEKHVSFIDETAVSFLEHSFEMNGKWGNYEHCIGPQNGCPFCLGQKPVYRVTVFTVIDHSTWTDKKGQTFTDQKKILAAKEDQAILLRDLSQMIGGLKGRRVVVRRGSNPKQSPAWGSSYSLAMHNGKPWPTDWTRFDKAVLVPFEYQRIYAQKTRAELEAIYQHVQMSSMSGRGVPVGGGYGQPQQYSHQPQYGGGYQQQQYQPPQQQWAPPPDSPPMGGGFQNYAPQFPPADPGVSVPAHGDLPPNPADQLAANDIPF